jgi:hypothetical protein
MRHRCRSCRSGNRSRRSTPHRRSRRPGNTWPPRRTRCPRCIGNRCCPRKRGRCTPGWPPRPPSASNSYRTDSLRCSRSGRGRSRRYSSRPSTSAPCTPSRHRTRSRGSRCHSRKPRRSTSAQRHTASRSSTHRRTPRRCTSSRQHNQRSYSSCPPGKPRRSTRSRRRTGCRWYNSSTGHPHTPDLSRSRHSSNTGRPSKHHCSTSCQVRSRRPRCRRHSCCRGTRTDHSQPCCNSRRLRTNHCSTHDPHRSRSTWCKRSSDRPHRLGRPSKVGLRNNRPPRTTRRNRPSLGRTVRRWSRSGMRSRDTATPTDTQCPRSTRR